MEWNEIEKKYIKKIVTKKNWIKWSRTNFIIDNCKWKNVLHLWACDWPFLDEKLSSWELLYKKIDAVSNKQIWIDLYKEWVEKLNLLKFKNSEMKHFNLNNFIDSDLKNENFDVIIMWEVIEHLMNLETAFTSIKSLMNEKTELIITTPNASRFNVFIFNFLWISYEHPDHKVAFHLFNLLRLLESNNFTIIKYWFLDYAFPNIWNSFIKIILRKIFSLTNYLLTKLFPLFWNTQIIVCKKSTKKED